MTALTRRGRHRADQRALYSTCHDHSVALRDYLATYGQLPPMPSPLRLDPGEVCYRATTALVEQWCGRSVTVPHGGGSTLLFGGPAMMLAGAAASAYRRGKEARRAQRIANQLAAPQWRPYGWLPVVATSHRYWICDTGQWSWTPWPAIRQLAMDPTLPAMIVAVEGQPPIRLSGPDAWGLGVVATWLTYGEVLDVPRLRPPDLPFPR